MSVENDGYYENFCIYCNGSGVQGDWDGSTVTCIPCRGRGQWDDEK